MIKFILSIYDKLISHRWLTLLLLFAVLAGSIAIALRMNYKEDIADFLPQDEISKKYSNVYSNIGGQNRIVLIFSTDSLENEDRLIEAMDSFESYWIDADTVHKIKDLQIRVEDTQIASIVEFVYENIPYFLEKEDYIRIDSLLNEQQYISQQLDNNKRMLMLPTSGFMAYSLPYDPLHLFSPILQKLQALNANSQYQIIDNYIFNEEGNMSLAFFSSPYGMSESMMNEDLSHFIDDIAQKTRVDYPDIKISAVGGPLIAVTNATQIKKDGLLGVILAVVLIFAILIIAFRRFDDIFWIGFSIIFGSIFALAVISIFKDNISIIVLGIGSVIIGIAVNYPLHFLDHLKHEKSKRTALKEMINPLLIGNITTVSAFLCLVFLDAEAMRDLGLFGSLTLIGTIIFVLIFLPILVSQRKKQKEYFQFNFDRFVPLSDGVKKKLFIPVVLITIVLYFFSLNTSFESNMNKINYMTQQQRSDMEVLSKSLDADKDTYQILVVAEGKDMEDALQQNENLLKSLQTTELSEEIVKVEGINNLIPSKARQEENLKYWDEFWAKYPDLIETFEKEATNLGFSKKAFDPFISSITSSYQPQDLLYFDPLLSLIKEKFVLQTESETRLVNYVYSSVDSGSELKEQIKENIPHSAFAFDSKDVSSQLVNILSSNFNYIGFVCGFIVFFFLWLSFRRVELALLSFLPLAVSWIWILGIMQIFGIQFNIVNIILATFIFGQGDDYTIFITEGMTYEYAYRKKVLKSYKNSVAISALIMFVGIGVLIFAKHPAMKSLAEVAIIGMIAVVILTYYLPPLIFNWITKTKGKYRDVPLTIKRIGYSLLSISFFLFGAFVYMIPLGFLYFLFGKTEKKRLNYHKLLCSISKFIINHVPGTKFSYTNRYNEQFDEPAIIVCNHQSHLDLMCLMMLTPKIILLTNDWVWKNPFYGAIIRWAEFYPVSDGVETNLDRLKSLTDRGYSIVIFPEGTRSEDCSIQRFHKGAFHYARQLNLDILPIFLHGIGHVLPKKDFMLREGQMYMEVGKRMKKEEVASFETTKKLTSHFSKLYKENYKTICNRCEDARYYIPYVKHKYMYKGRSIESNCRKVFNQIDSLAPYIDKSYEGIENIHIINSGQGEFAWLMALVHKEINVYAYESSEDLYLIALNCVNVPENLHFIHKTSETDFAPEEIVIDLKDIMRKA